jgi:Ca2+-binding EF-hand superfamily protein
VVSYDSFVLLCEEEMERVELRRRAKEKFMELDKDNSGILENAELHKVVEFMYHSLGCGTAKNKEAAKADMMNRVDANGDGKLDCSEFIALFEQVYVESNKPLEAIAATE